MNEDDGDRGSTVSAAATGTHRGSLDDRPDDTAQVEELGEQDGAGDGSQGRPPRRSPSRVVATALEATRARRAAVAARRLELSQPSPPPWGAPGSRGAPGSPVDPGPGTEPVEVPFALRAAAAWSWRLLLLGFVIYLLARGFAMFQVIVVPLLIALLFVALVRPIHEALLSLPRGARPPNGLAALLTILLSLTFVSALISLIGQQIATGFRDLQQDAVEGLRELRSWLDDGPLNISNAQLDGWIDQATASAEENSDRLVSGALSVTSTAGHVVTGFFLVLFASYFFLSGGRQIWGWIVGLFPRRTRPRVHGAGVRAWATLTSFVRATMIVALVDGVGVGIAAALIGVPLAIPLGVLVFIGAFVPIVGALVSGSVAVLVALVAVGPFKALLMLLAVILVQQVESHVLQPFLLGRAVQVHPLAVIVAIATGVLLAGIVGALFAVPLIAVVNVVVGYLNGSDIDGAPPGEDLPLDHDEAAGPLADDERPSPPPTAAEPAST